MLKYILIVLFSLLISGYYNYHSRPEISVSRRLLLFALRFISLSILLLLLISPIFYFTRHQQLKPILAVLSDNSASMDLPHGKLSKTKALQPHLEKMLSRYREAGYEIVEHRFANGLEGDNQSTLLGKSLTELSGDKSLGNLSTLLIASDGWLHDESLAAVNQLGHPIIVLADSSSNSFPDLKVNTVDAGRYAWRNEPSTMRADFSSENYDGPALAKLYIGDKLISSKNLNLKSGQQSSIDFTHRFNSTGFFPWRVELSPLANESLLGNNNYPGAIEVLAEKQRIVLISDKPAWDNKFTLDAISANPRWAVESYLNREGRLFGKNNQPTSLQSTNLASWVIVNNGSLKLDNTTANLVISSVDKGTGLLFQGLPLPELSSVLPMQRSNVQSPYQGFINPAPAAVNYPMLETLSAEVQNIPPVDYYYVTASSGAEVLATINNPQASPAIVAGTAAGKRTLGFSTLNLWRWQMQSGEDNYKKLISNCLTWLSTRSAGGFSAIYNPSYFLGEEISIGLRVEDDIQQTRLNVSPRIRILDKDNKEVISDFLTRDNREYRFKTFLDKPGTYSFEISDPESKQTAKGRFILGESSLETRDYGYNLPLLAWLANETGGKLLFLSAVDGYQPLPGEPLTQISRKELAIYKKWWVLSLFILAFCIELYLRRRWGLL